VLLWYQPARSPSWRWMPQVIVLSVCVLDCWCLHQPPQECHVCWHSQLHDRQQSLVVYQQLTPPGWCRLIRYPYQLWAHPPRPQWDSWLVVMWQLQGAHLINSIIYSILFHTISSNHFHVWIFLQENSIFDILNKSYLTSLMYLINSNWNIELPWEESYKISKSK